MQQHLNRFATTLHTHNAGVDEQFSEPLFNGLPIVAALATLTQLESEVRAAEMNALQSLRGQINNVPFLSLPLVFASAESNTVFPGRVYKARMLLVNALDVRYLKLQMRCDGRLIQQTANHIGQVRFVASQRPGPASWTGTILFRANGRDTTFQVRVPYRVARR